MAPGKKEDASFPTNKSRKKKRASEIFFCYTPLPPPPPFDTRGESNPGERRERRRKGKRQQHFLFPLFWELERKTAARLCQFLDVLFCHTHTRTLQLPPPGIRLFFGGFWRPRFWWGCAASVSVADQTGCLARKRKRGTSSFFTFLASSKYALRMLMERCSLYLFWAQNSTNEMAHPLFIFLMKIPHSK